MSRFTEAAERISADCYANAMRKAARALSKVYDAELKRSGLLLSQLIVLVTAARFGEKGAPMGRLARVLAMDPTTMTRNLRPLEAAGLLRVARSPEDARVRYVFLTRPGERKVEEAFPMWERAEEKIRRLIGGDRADRLRGELGRLVEAILKGGERRK